MSISAEPPKRSTDHRIEVKVFLFEAKNLPAMDRNGLSDPFCKFQIEDFKLRSRIIRKTLHPQWMEEFNFYLQETGSHILNISVWDWDRALRNEVMGRCQIDLAVLPHGTTHDMWVDIREKGSHRGMIHVSILIQERSIPQYKNPPSRPVIPTRRITLGSNDKLSTASADTATDNVDNGIGDDADWESVSLDAADQAAPMGVAVRKPLGSLTVYLQKLSELIMEPDGHAGKSVYCILQLGRVKFQTHTVMRSTSPEWDCEYEFPVYDVHSVLEVVVVERDAKGRKATLGCIGVPLLNIRAGVRRGYKLKDTKLLRFFQPMIWLQMNLNYDITLAAWRTLQPKDDVASELDTKPGSQILVHKVNQIRRVVTICSDALDLFRALLSWEIPTYSGIAYVLYMFIVYFFQLYWIPVLLLLLFLKGYVDHSSQNETAEPDYEAQFDSASGEASVITSAASSSESWNPLIRFKPANDLLQMLPENLSSRTFWRKLFSRETGSNLVMNARTAHEQARFVQHVLEFLADIYERLCNLFNFSVPWLSFFAVGMLCGAVVSFYLFSFRTVLLIWGTYEFWKGYFGLSNFELFAFLSRVHTKHEKRMYRELG